MTPLPHLVGPQAGPSVVCGWHERLWAPRCRLLSFPRGTRAADPARPRQMGPGSPTPSAARLHLTRCGSGRSTAPSGAGGEGAPAGAGRVRGLRLEN